MPTTAAVWMTTSQPSAWRCHAPGRDTSPTTIASSSVATRSTPRTSLPSARKRSTSARPMKPAAPVTKTDGALAVAIAGRPGFDHAEDLAHAAHQQALVLDLDPYAGRAREHDVVAGRDGHLEVRDVGRAVADGEHDALVGGQVVRPLGDEQARLAHAVGLELLDHDLLEEGAEDVGHRRGRYEHRPRRGCRGRQSDVEPAVVRSASMSNSTGC